MIRRQHHSTASDQVKPAVHRAPGASRRRHAVAAAGAAAVAAIVALTSIFAQAAMAGTNLSGLPWNSGVFLGGSTPASVSAFGTWRGDKVDVVTLWANRATWNDIVNPAWMYKAWQGQPQTLAFGVPMVPEKVPGVSIQACANGAYNSYWKQFGTNISSYGLGNSMIRLGWEFNGDWYIWKASDPASWAKCWQQVVTSARSTAPNLQWDWNVNRGVSAGLTDPTKAYPGDSYVTAIGVDSYDMWPPANTVGGWDKQLNGPQGLNYWLNFAIAHGKKLNVPEWGNLTTGGNPGGDDPAYVNDMYNFFKANAANLGYESYFNYSGGIYWPTAAVPNAAAAYKASF